MTTLKELQESFQRGILARDDKILSEVNDSGKERREVLFDVYRNGYVARLAEIMGQDYERTHEYLGDARFAQLIKDYIAANPSDQRSARWFGRHLPAFIERSEPYSRHPELIELATLEKALNDAFDAADAEPLRVEDLAALAPEAWPALEFAPHPTAARLTFKTNAAEIWSALREEQPPPKARRHPEPAPLLVWRQDFMARFKPLSTEEAMMWGEAVRGVRFSVLCEMVATFGGEDEAELRAASYLKDWVDMGMLAKRPGQLLAAPDRNPH